MNTFKDREQAFESKFAHDAEMQFRAIARRNKLTGLWAAEILGKTGEAAETYAMDVVKADFSEPGHAGVIRKLLEDLGDKADEVMIRAKLDELLVIAKAQLAEE